MYLGHHWSYKRPTGDPQITLNYCRALQDFLIDFQFNKGIRHRSPEATEAIVPSLLRRAWEEDNDQATLLWEIGQQGGVSGDIFMKVAYEEPYVDSIGRPHPGRARIIPLNPAHCFPEFHPHDRSRLLRFKLKYRFWGTSLEGTRQVFTYVELLTDEVIEEYVNDELIDSRPNPLGVIPIASAPNLIVSSSPWGLSDIQEIISLNRELNEKITELSDIINYHSAPVTVITGAKASNLEKGPRKVWGGLPKDASVTNLKSEADIAGILAYTEMLKRTMHEMTGVPETALGQEQPISNTSAAALAILYLPLYFRYERKKHNYTKVFKKVNELIMLTLAVKEPQAMFYDPSLGVPLKPDNLTQLDPTDPLTYKSDIYWPPPLPQDVLALLQELTQKIALGIETKVGALRALGEEQPEVKVQELFEEQVEELKQQGALEIMRAQIGMMATVLGGGLPPMPDPDGDGSSTSSQQSAPETMPAVFDPNMQSAQLELQAGLFNELVQKAWGNPPANRSTP
jgi:hypothetical protein